MNITQLLTAVLTTLLLLANTATADPLSVLDIQKEWAHVNYELKGDPQVAAFEKLIEQIDLGLANSPNSAELLIWSGISRSTLAGAQGGLGALGLAKEAKKALEKSMTIDDKALQGSAYTSLGTLYHNVPGWPIGFGSSKKALAMFEKALAINPDGIDPNYFYADYLHAKKNDAKAKQLLLKAQQAAPRPNRPLADSGRQQEIAALLKEVENKLR